MYVHSIKGCWVSNEVVPQENNAFASLDGDSLPSPTKSTAQGLSVSNYDTETGVLDTFLQFV